MNVDTALTPYQVLHIIYRWSRQKKIHRLYANAIPFYMRLEHLRFWRLWGPLWIQSEDHTHQHPCVKCLFLLELLWDLLADSPFLRGVSLVHFCPISPLFWGSRGCQSFQNENACPNKYRPLRPKSDSPHAPKVPRSTPSACWRYSGMYSAMGWICLSAKMHTRVSN